MHKGVRWFVYLENYARNGEPMTPLRMLCLNEKNAREEFAKLGAVALGREEILEVKE